MLRAFFKKNMNEGYIFENEKNEKKFKVYCLVEFIGIVQLSKYVLLESVKNVSVAIFLIRQIK